LFALSFSVSASIGQLPQEVRPSSDDRIAALENEVSALAGRVKELERLAEHQDMRMTFTYSLSESEANAIRPSLERLLARSVSLGLLIGADTRANRIVGTGTETQLSQLAPLVALIDGGLIQPEK
tara:strand:+ start:7144 stop:7518 length:375 start_codon:yes stop_codon:yes gene_type:complete